MVRQPSELCSLDGQQTECPRGAHWCAVTNMSLPKCLCVRQLLMEKDTTLKLKVPAGESSVVCLHDEPSTTCFQCISAHINVASA